jgi:hypothetical protein
MIKVGEGDRESGSFRPLARAVLRACNSIALYVFAIAIQSMKVDLHLRSINPLALLNPFSPQLFN